MKQVLQYRRSGNTSVVDVPAPLVPPTGVLVRNRWSLISPGTERMLVEGSGANLLNTARQRPDLVKQVVDKYRRDGFTATLDTVRSRLDVTVPLGYSCAGEVIDVSSGLADFHVGDRVACAGAGLANHAEFVGVPRRLTVRVPDAVSLEDAAFVTVGAIALQGVRIADVRVGDACLVIGLGLVGQLTVQLLKAAGCRVFGIDVAPDKIDLARALGADDACVREDPNLLERVKSWSLGRGADAILITAATSSSDPVTLAAQVARDRATVVAVGLVGMDVPRNAYYEKELDLRLSRSYGPGRYDKTYEQDGVDYPLGYVRWTEQRNMEAFLALIAEGKVQPGPLVTHRVPIAEAERAYEIVTGAIKEPYLGLLLEYPESSSPSTRADLASPAGSHSPPFKTDLVRVGFVGAGNFARAVLLPAFKKQGASVQLRGVATASGPSAHQTATRFGFSYAATDWRQVVDDPETDAIVVATRHDLHPEVAAAALRAGKAVLLEKPMALDEVGLETIMDAWQASGQVFLVGFNRRFAPGIQQLRELIRERQSPVVMAYRVNAGSVPPGSWVSDPVQGGGRIIGEVCHMVDTLTFLAGARVARVFAQPLTATNSPLADDVLLTLTFADGSLATITYASGGAPGLPKEYLEVHTGGLSAVLDDFISLTSYTGGKVRTLKGKGGKQDKGHAAEVASFLEAVRAGAPSPLDPRDAAHVTRVTFAALDSARHGVPVDL